VPDLAIALCDDISDSLSILEGLGACHLARRNYVAQNLMTLSSGWRHFHPFGLVDSLPMWESQLGMSKRHKHGFAWMTC
jgi:hypothetical protein